MATFKNITQTNISGRQALAYLKSRNITDEDILKYNIGYCETGPYKNMVVIPSYDANGSLNYYTGRSFEKEPKIKYKNPSVSRDIIPFELFINWDIPFILCAPFLTPEKCTLSSSNNASISKLHHRNA